MERHIINNYEILLLGRQDWFVSCSDDPIYTRYVWVKQVHGLDIYHITCDTPWLYTSIEADIILSADVPCGVYTADCIPIAFMSQETFAIAHVSWINLEQWIIQKTVKNLCRHSRAILDIVVYIWPSIRRYEVWGEFVDKFPWFVSLVDSKYLFDMVWYTVRVCKELGINSKNIHIHSSCTYIESDSWYSRRRLKDTWRNFMWVRKLSSMSS